MKYRRNNLRFLFTVLLIYLNEQLNGVNCDLSIFAQADTAAAAAAHAVNLYNDKLYYWFKVLQIIFICIFTFYIYIHSNSC